MGRLARFAPLLVAAALAGCGTSAPINNVSNAKVVSPAGKQLSPVQVREAIVRAGAALGWIMRDSGPGKLTGVLMLRTHKAEVEIPYSTSSYSITYKSSVNLDEGGGKIHRNYNGWILNLSRGIDAQLAAS